MERGTVVLVHFPFTDYNSHKLRPAVIISTNNKTDVCVAFISSVIPIDLEDSDHILNEDDAFFAATGLKERSVFRMKKIATVDKKIVIGKIGAVPQELQSILKVLRIRTSRTFVYAKILE